MIQLSTMAPSFSSARELAVASRKRPHSPAPSDSSDLSSAQDSASDFGTSAKPNRKVARKKARSTKSSDTVAHNGVVSVVPKAYRSEEDHALFSNKWWKEIAKRDEFWMTIMKNVPKTVLQKRLKVEIMVDIEGNKKEASVGRKIATASASGKPRTAANKKLSAEKAGDVAMARTNPVQEATGDSVTTIPAATRTNDTGEDLPMIELVPHKKADSAESTLGSIRQLTTLEADDDPLARIIADSSISPEVRAQYLALQESQADALDQIEVDTKQRRIAAEMKRERMAKRNEVAATEAVVDVDAELIAKVDTETLEVTKGGEVADVNEGASSIQEAASKLGPGVIVNEDALEPASTEATSTVEASLETIGGVTTSEIIEKKENPRKIFNPTKF